MRSILCFGDSNTWGFIPGSGGRYAPEVRWPGVLQKRVGPEYKVIEEGLNGRTTVWDDPAMPGRNGQQYLFPCLLSHRPLDAVIVALGINDLKAQFAASADDIARGAAKLLQIIRESEAGIDGKVIPALLISPPLIGKLTEYAPKFEGAREKSERLGECMRAAAAEAGAGFLDTAKLAGASDLDGIHLSEEAHLALGNAVADWLHSLPSMNVRTTFAR